MLESWFGLCERFVVAVEGISGAMKAGGRPESEIVDATFGQPQETAKKPDMTGAKEAEALKRELLKTELRAKGIKFNASSKTETLQKLLDAAADLPPVDAPAPEKPRDTTAAPATPAIEVTKDQVREALVALSAIRGKDVGLHILKTEGNATKLAEVAPERYGHILDACRREEALANV